MAEGNTDPAGINPGNESHQKSHAHKSRRGRFRHSNDENLSSQQYGHFNQGFRSQFGQNGSNYTRQQHPHHQDDNLSRRRGRGRREVSRSANGSFFSQTPGEEHSKYTDNRSVEGPDAANWRREPDRNIEQTNVEQEGQPKKPRKYSQEQKARRPNEKGPRPKEDNAKDEGQWSNHAKAESPLDVRERTHGKREEGPDLQYEEQSRKRPEMKRRQGPIKPAKPLYQEERGPDVEAGGGQESSHNSHNAFRTGRGSGRYTSSQPRGGRRTHPQSQRPSQRNWDKVPESKETQTGCLIEQLSEEKYECMVCCDVIRHMAPVWSCQSCFHVFHLNCIKKWARSPASQADADSNEGWRCPACQNVALKHPTSYTCFCGKVINPEWHHSEIPHSCGNMCGKKRGGLDCNHPCNILCHPGPCPQCPAFITKSCVCGKTSQPVRCGQGAVLKCNRECGALLNCADHTCAQVCHSGTCQPCQLQVQQTCYCGVTTRQALCGTDREALNGSGYFCCQKICGKMLNCGAHRCQQVCHSGQCQPCSRSPSLVKTCPCGQTPLVKLMELGYSERQSCSDPIPSCGKTCSKPLACGSNDSIHLCEKLCHEGSCGPCSLTSTIKCRCGSKTMDVPCATIHSEAELVFACERRCNKKRSCGRHKCGELCCVNLDHKCVMICGYKLNCGLHRCQETCHRGNCEPCWQSSFDELTCHCGLTILYPPIACGTKPPECKNVCTRRHECEHPVLHNCHGDEKCPPCTHLTQKWCMGKHEQRSNIPCHLQDISCGLTCNKTLPCGGHRCKKICHRGDCVGEGGCRQPCMQPRLDCGHPCSAPCHQGSSCPRTSCSAKVALQCDCGRRKETVICSEAASSHQKYAAIAMASKLSDMQLGDSMDMGPLLTKKEMKQARLECDQECATLERNRRLAEALQISSFSDPFNTRANSVYSDSLKEDARRDLKFVSEVEGEIRNLVELANKGKQPKRSHCFPAMNREHRRIIHELAEVYGVESVSYDSEPKRNVVVTAQKGKGACPSSTLTLVIERETSTRAPPPIAHIKQQTSKVAGGSTRSKMAKEEPVIDYFDVQD